MSRAGGEKRLKLPPPSKGRPACLPNGEKDAGPRVRPDYAFHPADAPTDLRAGDWTSRNRSWYGRAGWGARFPKLVLVSVYGVQEYAHRFFERLGVAVLAADSTGHSCAGDPRSGAGSLGIP